MVIKHADLHTGRSKHIIGEKHRAWLTHEPPHREYSIEDDLLDQLEKLLKPEDVEELLISLHVPTLRQLAIEVVNGSVRLIYDSDKLQYLKLLNSWLATAEETVAAGSKRRRIASRRKSAKTLAQ